jgi:predicted RNA-binding protein with PIN domain
MLTTRTVQLERARKKFLDAMTDYIKLMMNHKTQNVYYIKVETSASGEIENIREEGIGWGKGAFTR